MKRFYESMESHQIKPQGGFSQRVTLESSDNKYFKYPVTGVLVILEQGINLSIISAVFHKQEIDGSLGAPCTVKNLKHSSL